MPKVSIVVITYLERSKQYLDLCIESIRRLDYPAEQLEVILVGRKSYAPTYDGVRTVWPEPEEFGNAVGLNYGLSLTDPSSTHILMLNDDVILTRDSLKNMVAMAGTDDMLLMPISPCDNYLKYSLHFPFEHLGAAHALTERFYRYDDLAPYAGSLMRARSIYPQGAIVTDMLCLFCCLIPRSTYEKIGAFDEGFKTGQDDYDYCIRARQLNIPRLIALNVLVWHFGGVTADHTLTPEVRMANIEHFKAKWPGEKL